MRRILFVCTGNTCRSPMAEGLFRKLAQEAGLDMEVKSAGVSAMDDSPISTSAEAVLRQHEAYDGHASQRVTEALVIWADLILTMTMSHKRMLNEQFPQAVDKTYTLKEFTEDNTEVMENIAIREQWAAELAMKQALSQPIRDEDIEKLIQLEKQIPNFDIADPFGGSMGEYQACAAEIREAIMRLITRLTTNKG